MNRQLTTWLGCLFLFSIAFASSTVLGDQRPNVVTVFTDFAVSEPND